MKCLTSATEAQTRNVERTKEKCVTLTQDKEMSRMDSYEKCLQKLFTIQKYIGNGGIKNKGWMF